MSRVFKGCKVMLAAAKAGTPRSSAAAAAATAATASARKATPKLPKPPKPSTQRTLSRPSGISKTAPVSPALRKFLGLPEASRVQAVKKIWEHIKLHNLQNPNDKRVILCDEKLKTIFDGKDQVGMLEIGKLISHHFVKTD